MLSGAAGTPIRRIQWVERTVPAQGDELARWLHSERDPAVPLRGTPMIDSYLELIGTTARVTQEHEILVAVQVDSRGVRDRGADAVARALVEQTERVAQGLESRGGDGARRARPRASSRAPCERRSTRTRGPSSPRSRPPTRPPGASPNRPRGRPGRSEHWDHYRADGAVHATYWIGGWPRVDVSPMFMDALLGRSSAVRTVGVTIEPIPPERSTRQAEAAVTRDRADRELRAPLRPIRDRPPAAGRRGDGAPGVGARGRPRRGEAGRVRDRSRPGRRRSPEGVLRGARARSAGRGSSCTGCTASRRNAFTFALPLCRGLR